MTLRLHFPDIRLIFPRPFKIARPTKNFLGPTNFFPGLLKCNFLTTFPKFSQLCLYNTDFRTTSGRFSQKSLPCRPGSYSHGSLRPMISTEIIKTGGGAKWVAENNLAATVCI